MGVSLLITTYNRTALLERSLARLAELTVPDEVIVVDDGGTDDCAAACRRAAFPVRYRWLDNPGMTNCCRARNYAVRLAQHDTLIISEPELLFITDVVAQMVEGRREFPDAVLREPWCYHEPEAGVELSGCNEVPGFYVNCYEKPWLVDIGGWDEDLPGPWAWDDIDAFGRLEQTGHPRIPLDGLRVRHQWHPSRIEPAVENEAYVRSKVFPRDLRANQGKELFK